MELFEKRVKSRLGYNIISLSMPSFEEYQERVVVVGMEEDEEALKRRYMISADPRLAATTEVDFDLCSAETLVLACIIKLRLNNQQGCTFTAQLAYREYCYTVKPQLEAMSMVRPLTLGQFCRVRNTGFTL